MSDENGSSISLYTTASGGVELNVKVLDDTVWLSLLQLSHLFGRDKSVISRHINNIYKINELERGATVAKYATVQNEAGRQVKRDVDYYNLDLIISLGYRVNSKEGIHFRKWASHILKQYIIKGYSLNQQRLEDSGVQELQNAIELLSTTLTRNKLVHEIGTDIIGLIIQYSKTWSLLLRYDENNLSLINSGKKSTKNLNYEQSKAAISALKENLIVKGEGSNLFGQEREQSLSAILGNLEQTFDGKALYETIEIKAAHLLYFVIKDHPFSDGNKRIGALLFLAYLNFHEMKLKLNDNGVVALTLLVAESAPSQKELIIRLIVNLLSEEVV